MKFFTTVLLTLAVLSASAHAEKQLRAAENEDDASRQLYYAGGHPVRYDAVSGSCGCAGDAVLSIQDTYQSKLPALLPIWHWDKKAFFYLKKKFNGDELPRTMWLSTHIKKYMSHIVELATCKLANVDCGDCTGYPLNYCGAVSKDSEIPTDEDEYEDMYYLDKSKPSTYDCCCDVRQIRDIAESCLCSLAEEVVVYDPASGHLVYARSFQKMVAWDIYNTCATAILKTAETFCPLDEINWVVLPKPANEKTALTDDGTDEVDANEEETVDPPPED